MLAYLFDKPFNDTNWIFEIKWDGYRALAEVSKGKVALYSRNLISFEKQFPTIYRALKEFQEEAVFDGEIVILDAKGRSQFQLLQNYLNSGEGAGSLRYFVFDLLYYKGQDLRQTPLIERKELLKKALKDVSPLIVYGDYVEERGVDFFKEAEKIDLEGMLAKEKSSLYLSTRSKNWLKIKIHKQQEAVIVGFTYPKGTRKYLGSLVLGVYKKGQLTFVGHSGGGFSQKFLKELYEKLQPLIIDHCPFNKIPKLTPSPIWVEPKLVCEVSFREWTSDGMMRQPKFLGMRMDKPSKDVVKEVSKKNEAVPKISTPKKTGKQKDFMTHLDKVYWPEDGYTKGDLLSYYEEVSSYILPHLKDRQLMLHRFPNGIEDKEFFQKQAPDFLPDWIQTESFEHSEKKVTYIVANDKNSLLYICNLGTIDIHPFLNRYNHPDHPDFLVLDLDPQGLDFDKVVEVALVIHDLLDGAEIAHYPKTSGKRGLHIYLPLGAKYDYATVEQFSNFLARLINQKLPEITSVIRDPKKRNQKVYIDFLQNSATKTIVAPYSVRALKGATVATPLDWSEVKKGLDPKKFTIKTVPKRLKGKGDLLKNVLGKGIDLPKAFKRLEKLIQVTS